MLFLCTFYFTCSTYKYAYTYIHIHITISYPPKVMVFKELQESKASPMVPTGLKVCEMYKISCNSLNDIFIVHGAVNHYIVP
jgi:hypothetical protein